VSRDISLEWEQGSLENCIEASLMRRTFSVFCLIVSVVDPGDMQDRISITCILALSNVDGRQFPRR
jgi:hypothetical protein